MIKNRHRNGCARILVRLDANHQIGMAHAIRVSSVLGMLKQRHEVIIAGSGELIEKIFPRQENCCIQLRHQDEFYSYSSEIKPDIVVVDCPCLDREFWICLKNKLPRTPIVAIDDEGGSILADLVINGTVLDQYHKYPLMSDRSKILCGKDYSLIRPEFSETPWKNPVDPSVVIVVGSADRATAWAHELVSGKIEMKNWGKVRMVVGLAFPGLDLFRKKCAALGISVSSGLSGKNMSEVMSEASLALITGGMIVYEALAVGVPSIVFPQEKNLIPEAKWFSRQGCIVDLGYNGGMDCDFVSKNVIDLLCSNTRRADMSSRQRSTIDGRGMVRAAMAIDRLLGFRNIGFEGYDNRLLGEH